MSLLKANWTTVEIKTKPHLFFENGHWWVRWGNWRIGWMYFCGVTMDDAWQKFRAYDLVNF